MAFNFGSLSNVQPASTISYLKPYNIYHNVTIDQVEVLEGTSASGTPWRRLEITFKCEEGVHKESIFWITSDKDFERGSAAMPNGGKRELPSNWERTRDKMAAIGFAFAPEAFTKLQSLAERAKSFDDIANAFQKMLNNAIGKNPTNMKLVGRTVNGSVYATLPNCTGIAQANDEKRAAANKVSVGDWYTWMVSPFNDNASKLAFTNYEQKQADEYHNAKPTSVGNSTVDTDAANDFDSAAEGSEEIDFGSLL